MQNRPTKWASQPFLMTCLLCYCHASLAQSPGPLENIFTDDITRYHVKRTVDKDVFVEGFIDLQKRIAIYTFYGMPSGRVGNTELVVSRDRVFGRNVLRERVGKEVSDLSSPWIPIEPATLPSWLVKRGLYAFYAEMLSGGQVVNSFNDDRFIVMPRGERYLAFLADQGVLAMTNDVKIGTTLKKHIRDSLAERLEKGQILYEVVINRRSSMINSVKAVVQHQRQVLEFRPLTADEAIVEPAEMKAQAAKIAPVPFSHLYAGTPGSH